MTDKHVNVLAVLAVLENVCVLRLTVLNFDDGLDQLVVLLDAFSVPIKW